MTELDPNGLIRANEAAMEYRARNVVKWSYAGMVRISIEAYVATEPDRTRAAVVKALRKLGKRHDVAEAYEMANAIEDGADW